MARTILSAGFTAGQSTIGVTNQYYNLTGELAPYSLQGTTQTKFSFAGTLYGFGICISENTLASGPTTFTVLKNNTATAFVIAVGTGGTTGWFEDPSDTVTVAANDVFEVRATLTAGEINSCYFTVFKTEYDTNTSTTNTISILSSHSGGTAASTTYYQTINGSGGSLTTETDAQSKVQYSATLRNFRVKIDTNSRTTTTTFRTRKNAVNGNQSVVVGSTATGWFEDTTNTDSVVSGDLINFTKVNGTGTLSMSSPHMQVDHQTTTNPGVGILVSAMSGASTLGEPLTRYQHINGALNSWSASTSGVEAFQQLEVSSAFTFKGLSVKASVNAITGSTVFTLRKNGANTSLTTSITSSSTAWFQDTTHTETVAAGDLLNYMVVTPDIAAATPTMTVRQILIYTEIAAPSTAITTTVTGKAIETKQIIHG